MTERKERGKKVRCEEERREKEGTVRTEKEWEEMRE